METREPRAPYTYDEEHGHYQRNAELDIAWKIVFQDSGIIEKIIFIGERSEQNFVKYIKRSLQKVPFGLWGRRTMEFDLGCCPNELDHFLAAAGLALVWMPVLLKKDDKRIPELMKFEVNHAAYYAKKEG